MEKYFSHNKCWPSNSYCARKNICKGSLMRRDNNFIVPLIVWGYCVRSNRFTSNYLGLGSHNRDNTYSNIRLKIRGKQCMYTRTNDAPVNRSFRAMYCSIV